MSAILLLSTGTAQAACTATPPFPLGAYLYNPDAWNAANEEKFSTSYESFVGLMRTTPIFLANAIDYRLPTEDWVSSASEQAQSNARSAYAKTMIPLIGLPMRSIAAGAPTPDAQFRSLASGRYDAVVDGIVAAWTEQGFTTLMIRLGWEMNLPETPSYAGDDATNQANWVSAFQHLSARLRRAAAAHGARVQIIWNPGVTGYSNAAATRSLWPGASFVDIIGADIYADASPYTDTNRPPTYHDWQTGRALKTVSAFIANPVNRRHYWNLPSANRWTNDGSAGHSLSFDQLITFARQQSKPFAVTETGAGNTSNGGDIADDADFPAWLTAKLHAAQTLGLTVSFVALWDADMGGTYGFSLPSAHKPAESSAWARAFGARADCGGPVGSPG